MIKMSRISKEEKEITRTYKKGEWHSIGKSKLKPYKTYANATFKKDKRVNIRISSKDLNQIQKLAIEEGLPYQTLIASILHKYVSGKLKPSKT